MIKFRGLLMVVLVVVAAFLNSGCLSIVVVRQVQPADSTVEQPSQEGEVVNQEVYQEGLPNVSYSEMKRGAVVPAAVYGAYICDFAWVPDGMCPPDGYHHRTNDIDRRGWRRWLSDQGMYKLRHAHLEPMRPGSYR